jgi:hypothetical protein
MPNGLAELYWRLNNLETDVKEIKNDLHSFRAEEKERRTEEAEERKADRRWRIGTSLAVCSVIVIAAGIVVQSL